MRIRGLLSLTASLLCACTTAESPQDSSACISDDECDPGMVCIDAQCTLPPRPRPPMADAGPAGLVCDGGQLCDERCVDLENDPAHCGLCGVECGPSFTCRMGSCVETCPAETELCESGCVDLSSSPENCGACGSACGEGSVCRDGQCWAPVVLTHSTSDELESNASITCRQDGTNFHFATSFYRVFDLEALVQPSSIEIERIRFGVQAATSRAGTQPLQVRISELVGPFRRANLIRLVTQEIQVEDQTLTHIEVPVEVTLDPNKTYVAELFTPSGIGSGASLRLGANTQGQSGPTYGWSSSEFCPTRNNEPAPAGQLGRPTMHLVLELHGRTLEEFLD